MPRGIPNKTRVAQEAPTALTFHPLQPGEAPHLTSLDVVLEELRALLEARRTEYLSAADIIGNILAAMSPKPRIGRPPKKLQ